MERKPFRLLLRERLEISTQEEAISFIEFNQRPSARINVLQILPIVFYLLDWKIGCFEKNIRELHQEARMKYKVVQQFPVPLKDLLKAREDRYKYLDRFPELKNVELLEEKKDGNLVYQKRKVKLAESMPKVLATLLSDPSLLENSTFDLNTNTHEFTLAPPGNENILQINGVSVYKELGPDKSERSYDVEVKSGVFLMGAAIEAVIEEVHKHSLEKDKNSISEFLKSYQM